MRIISLALVGVLAFGTAASAQSRGVPGWPSASPKAVYPPSLAGRSDFARGSTQVFAQRAANMINSGKCKGALRMALREREYEVADRIVEICHIDKAGHPL